DVLGDGDTGLDHCGGRAGAVPHEVVEVGYVHEEVGARGEVPGLGRAVAWRVVLEVDDRTAQLWAGKKLEAVDEVVLAGLREYDVEVEVGHGRGRYFVQGVGPRALTGRPPPVSGWP